MNLFIWSEAAKHAVRAEKYFKKGDLENAAKESRLCVGSETGPVRPCHFYLEQSEKASAQKKKTQ